MNRITDDEAKNAEGVIRRYYWEWVQGLAMGLAEEVLSGDVDDAEGLREKMEQDCDSALIYTHDQHMVLFASESTSDGQQEMEDMGGGGDNVLAVWALMTFQVDVREAMERLGLDWDFDRDEWLKAVAKGEHGPELSVAWDRHLERGGKGLGGRR